MGDAERSLMADRLAGMTDEQKDKLLLELAEGMRPGDDTQGRGRVQSAEAILALRPKVEVWTFLPRTGRIDKRTQDRKVWDTPGVMDPYATEDMPDRPQIIKVIDLRDGTVLFERDSVLGQPTPGRPVGLGVATGVNELVQRHVMGPVSDAELAERMIGLLRGHPELRRAVMAMDTTPAPAPVGQGPPWTEEEEEDDDAPDGVSAAMDAAAKAAEAAEAAEQPAPRRRGRPPTKPQQPEPAARS
jgi:hypothetical protein